MGNKLHYNSYGILFEIQNNAISVQQFHLLNDAFDERGKSLSILVLPTRTKHSS